MVIRSVLKTQLPDLEVKLIHSPAVPVIGVGESTTAYFPQFLREYLRFDMRSFYEAVRPVWKLGLLFDWSHDLSIPEYQYAFEPRLIRG